MNYISEKSVAPSKQSDNINYSVISALSAVNFMEKGSSGIHGFP